MMFRDDGGAAEEHWRSGSQDDGAGRIGDGEREYLVELNVRAVNECCYFIS